MARVGRVVWTAGAARAGFSLAVYAGVASRDTRPTPTSTEAVEMLDGGLRADEIRSLAEVAAYLCSALETLTAAGCDWLAAAVRDILGAIERRMSLLESVVSDASP